MRQIEITRFVEQPKSQFYRTWYRGHHLSSILNMLKHFNALLFLLRIELELSSLFMDTVGGVFPYEIKNH